MTHAFGDNTRFSRFDKITHLCPCPGVTAYWTPPPAWPKRLCDNKLFSLTTNRTYCFAAAAIFFIYFFVMDIFLFARYRTANLVNEAKAGDPGELYSPFTHLSVKAIISDHVRHYIFTPSAEYFNSFTHFSKTFTFITPNMISLLHLICSFISGKFIASEHLQDRRIGVIIYTFRTWLDSLDGIVFRDQAGHYLQYNSVYSSYGYIVDALFDTLGGFFLSIGVLFYLFKRFGSDAFTSLPMRLKNSDFSPDSSTLTNGHAVPSRREGYTYRYLFLKTLSYGLSLSLAGICWDRAVKGFTEVFQVHIADPSLAVSTK